MIACYSGSRRRVSIRSGRWGMQSGTHCTSAKLPATTVSLHLVHLQDDSWVLKEEGRMSESGNLGADWLDSWRRCRILAWSSPFRLEILCQRVCSRISGSLPFNSSNLDFFFLMLSFVLTHSENKIGTHDIHGIASGTPNTSLESVAAAPTFCFWSICWALRGDSSFWPETSFVSCLCPSG